MRPHTVFLVSGERDKRETMRCVREKYLKGGITVTGPLVCKQWRTFSLLTFDIHPHPPSPPSMIWLLALAPPPHLQLQLLQFGLLPGHFPHQAGAGIFGGAFQRLRVEEEMLLVVVACCVKWQTNCAPASPLSAIVWLFWGAKSSLPLPNLSSLPRMGLSGAND